MKKVILLSIAFLFFNACSCYKHKGVKIKNTMVSQFTMQKENIYITEKISILPNSSILYKKDKFGVGYYKVVPGTKTVFIYTYKEEPVNKNLRDAGYTEEVIFEIKGKIKEMELKDEELKKVNLLVGIHGFFKRAGVYPVTKGYLKINLPKKDLLKLQIHIDKPDYMVRKKDIVQEIPLLTR